MSSQSTRRRVHTSLILHYYRTHADSIRQDAEFPGIVARPIGNFAGSKAEYHYQTLRCNVDLLKPIQLGITVWTSEGELPPQQPDPALISQLNGKSPYPNNLMYLPCTWVFNFKFNLNEDMFSEPSISLLEQSGVEFEKNREMGIDLDAFGSLLTTSGLVFSDEVNWLSFHSGYDFGYLIKLLTAQGLPEDQSGFFDIVGTYFPKLWDIKFLLRHAQRMNQQGRLSQESSRMIGDLGQRSGLQDLADLLSCHRVGPAHTGGSDAWLTGSVFWAMRTRVFGGDLPDDLADQIYGLHGVPLPASQQYREEFFAAQGTPQQQANGLSGVAASFASNHTPNNPSTPTSTHAGLNTGTPGPHYGHSMAGSSMGAAGFGNFQYGK
jgi:CCR4-NOT transcription complex subunit 7/8